MEIQVQEVESCKLSVIYEANVAEILDKKAEVLNAFKKAPIPGCRKGKASLDVIKNYYRKQIDSSLKMALTEDAFQNTVFEKKLRTLGAPVLKTSSLDNAKFVCEFDVMIKPDFQLTPYKELEIPKPHEQISSMELAERMLQELRVRFGETIVISETDTIQTNDNIIIDYEGTLDGEKISSLSADGEAVTIGKSQLPGFDDNLIGMKLGETKEFDLFIPETMDYLFAGKTIHFKTTANIGSRTVPCPLNEELAKRFGKTDLNELREFVNKTAMGRIDSLNKSALNAAISARLIDNNKFSIPNWLSLSEAKYLAANTKINWDESLDEEKQKFIEMGEKNIKLSLILDKVREEEPEAQLTDQEVFDMIKQNLANTNVKTSVNDVIKEMQRTGYLQILFSRIKDEYVLDFIMKTTKFID